MGLSKTIWSKPAEFLSHEQPEHPVMFFAPGILQDSARRFIDGFPGLVTYAVKANPSEAVIENLAAAGLRGFDVSSPAEIMLVRRLVPEAALHYNNPVRSRSEIATALALGVQSWAVDSQSELTKLLAQLPDTGHEISVRFALPRPGTARKFGATPTLAADLLARVAAAGLAPSLTFHAGTQCTDPAVWEAHILEAARISHTAGTQLSRLNVGGGFPGHRQNGKRPDLTAIFDRIAATVATAFGPAAPALVCEPGRGIVAESFTLASRVKAVRDDQHVFLNDGTYGSLDELPLVGLIDRTQVVAPTGQTRSGTPSQRIVFGPTCDSVDRLPGALTLPGDIAEDDYLLIHGMGAYSLVTNTRFNGFGDIAVETVLTLG